MVLMSTGSGGAGEGWLGSSSKLSYHQQGWDVEGKSTLCVDRLLTHLENASTLMLRLGSKQNKVARMTVHILYIFWLLEQLDHFFPTIKEIVKWTVLPGG